MITIMSASREILHLIRQHHVYAVECLIKDIVWASADEPYINEDVIIALVKSAYECDRTDKASVQ